MRGGPRRRGVRDLPGREDRPKLGDVAKGELELPSTWFVATRDAALFDALCAGGWTPP